MAQIEDATSNEVKAEQSKMFKVGDLVNANYYIGVHERITRPSKVLKVYNKEKYNMLLVEYKTKSKIKLRTCLKQLKSGIIWP